jgi:hypothetical protein
MNTRAEAVEPIFRSGHEALRYAYAYNAQQYPMTIMGRMMRGRLIGSGRGLYGLDGAAIAGSVKRVVESLPGPYRSALECRYSITADERARAALRLVRPVLPALGTGIYHTRFVGALVARHFGEKIRLEDLSAQYEMSGSTVARRWADAKRRLVEIESKASTLADDALADAGLVSSRWRK